ncbi:MAG: DUF378 domain-containing protein [Fibrobacter sp.]|nr:DUF378 domain-containing protein [Fibrobacter sp.]
MKNLNFFDWISLILLIIGGINWGLVGFFQYDLFVVLFSSYAPVIYAIVGLASIYMATISPHLRRKITVHHRKILQEPA